MSILLVSGSSLNECSNSKLLDGIIATYLNYHFQLAPDIRQLPLFIASEDRHPWSAAIIDWRNSIKAAQAVIIVTPEYLHNIPAVLKNALEWLTSSGELNEKAVIPITYTPHAPRGEKAMLSLIASLTALNARVPFFLSLHKDSLSIAEEKIVGEEAIEMIHEALRQLTGR
jgi:NAD(P)H-dependent FMN reductase